MIKAANPFLISLVFVSLIAEVSAQCTICYNDAPGFDPTLEYFDTENGQMEPCSLLKENLLAIGETPFCSLFQKIAYDSCGCQEYPAAAACPVCYEDGPGFDPTREYVDEDGEIAKCSEVAAAIALTGDNPAVCTLFQLNNYINCGCSTKPEEDNSTNPEGEKSTCTVCYENGPGFDPSLEFVGDDGVITKCSDIAASIALLGENPTFCTTLQLNNHLHCGCSTVPQGVGIELI